jgi:hypothetical protein
VVSSNDKPHWFPFPIGAEMSHIPSFHYAFANPTLSL